MDEVCDDGNSSAGDGCSSDCRSSEICGNGIVDPVRSTPAGPVPREQCDDRNISSHDGCASACVPEVPRWVHVDTLPARRMGAAMATEAAMRRIVMFGGVDYLPQTLDEHRNDTWEWTRDGWARVVTTSAPAPRSGHAMASDGARTVMFGGTSGSSVLDDTWVFERHAWTLLDGFRPPARAEHAMAYMPGVGVVMFGGRSSSAQPLADTWILANGAWTPLGSSPSPPARRGHTMTYDPSRNVIVLAGGASSAPTQLGTWEFDGVAWSLRPAAAIDLVGATAAFDQVRRRVLLFGRTNAGKSAAWEWDGTTWSPATPPSQRWGATAGTDPNTGLVLVFGGGIPADPLCGACPAFDTSQDTLLQVEGAWKNSEYITPGARDGHAASYDVDRRRVVVFGGWTGSGLTNETLEGTAAGWRLIPAGAIPARTEAAMAYVAVGSLHATVLFGGANLAGTSFDDTWAWNGRAWTNLAPQVSPGPRAAHAMAFDPVRKRLVLFGGRGTIGPLSDTWEFDGATWKPMVSPTNPGPRTLHAMAYDPIAQRVLLFGGAAAPDDLWSWDGLSWTKLPTAISPAARDGSGLAWDAARQRMVLFGGGQAFSNESWEWDGTSWSFVSAFNVPAGRTQHTLTPSPTGAGVLAVGGFVLNRTTEEILHLLHDSPAPSARCNSAVDDDFDGAAGCADPDCFTTCSPWCPPNDDPGAACDLTLPRCGDGICDPDREACGICADCPCSDRCGDFSCGASESHATCPGDCP